MSLFLAKQQNEDIQLYCLITTFSGMQEKYLQNPYKALRDKVSEKCILYVVPCLKT